METEVVEIRSRGRLREGSWDGDVVWIYFGGKGRGGESTGQGEGNE
jgi:hypothetical protein